MIETAILCAALTQVDVASHTQKMVEAQPPPMVAWDCYDPVQLWLVPEADGTWLLHLRHTCRVCCFEFGIPVPDSYDSGYWGYPPMHFFQGEGMSYRTLDLPEDHTFWPWCQGQGQGIASYPLGGMWDAYSGPVGLIISPPPLEFGHNDNCPPPNPPNPPVIPEDFVIYSGVTPNWPLEYEYWITGPCDYDGNGVVGVNDLLKVLEWWGVYGVDNFLGILANWAAEYP